MRLALWNLAARIFVLAVLLGAREAQPHDYWSDGKRVDPQTKNLCCSGSDTKELDSAVVKPVAGGFLLTDTHEFIPADRVQPPRTAPFGRAAGAARRVASSIPSASEATMLDRNHFFAAMRAPLFGGVLAQDQVEGMTHLLDVWEECYAAKYLDMRFLAYALATTFHETARTMQPIEEIGKGRGRAYGHPAGPWHKVYDGRGDVQLTFERNYKFASVRLAAETGIKADLDQHPDIAMEPDIAAHIMYLGMIEGWFSGRKLGDYFSAKLEDALHARRIINGLDKATLIAGYFRAFLPAMVLLGEAKAA